MAAAQKPMTLYTSQVPNCYKVSIALEELGIPYESKLLDISKGEQKEDWFVAINPNGRLPTIVDHQNNDHTVMESGAILYYLAEKAGDNSLFPSDLTERSEVMQWLMFQMAGVGPMFGQAAHFVMFAPEKIAYGQKRYVEESYRLLTVMEKHLEGKEYFANNKYSIADIAMFGWALFMCVPGLDIEKFPNFKAWYARLMERPAVQKGVKSKLPSNEQLKDSFFDFEAKKKFVEGSQKTWLFEAAN